MARPRIETAALRQDTHAQEAAAVLAASLEQTLGWPAHHIYPNDSMSSLLIAEDDLDLINLHMELEGPIGAQVPVEFFYQDLPKLTFAEAAKWLARSKAAGG